MLLVVGWFVVVIAVVLLLLVVVDCGVLVVFAVVLFLGLKMSLLFPLTTRDIADAYIFVRSIDVVVHVKIK